MNKKSIKTILLLLSQHCIKTLRKAERQKNWPTVNGQFTRQTKIVSNLKYEFLALSKSKQKM
jgi:hypothetical protein